MACLRAWIRSRLSPAGGAFPSVDTTPELPSGASLPDDPVGALLALTTVRHWQLTDDNRLLLRTNSLVWLQIDPEDKGRWIRGWADVHPTPATQAMLWELYYTLARARVQNADRALAHEVLGRARQKEFLSGQNP